MAGIIGGVEAMMEEAFVTTVMKPAISPENAPRRVGIVMEASFVTIVMKPDISQENAPRRVEAAIEEEDTVGEVFPLLG